MPNTLEPKLESPAHYFLNLALNGQYSGASSGELRAARIASALADLVDDLSGIDRQAVEGVCVLVKAAGSGRARFVEQLLKPE